MRKVTFKLVFLAFSLFIALESLACHSSRHNEQTDHQYALRSDGDKTWRVDVATGQTCIKLMPAADWKNKENKTQSCPCVDLTDFYKNLPSATDEQKKKTEGYYNTVVKPACGNT